MVGCFSRTIHAQRVTLPGADRSGRAGTALIASSAHRPTRGALIPICGPLRPCTTNVRNGNLGSNSGKLRLTIDANAVQHECSAPLHRCAKRGNASVNLNYMAKTRHDHLFSSFECPVTIAGSLSAGNLEDTSRARKLTACASGSCTASIANYTSLILHPLSLDLPEPAFAVTANGILFRRLCGNSNLIDR
jgi:hypothetical protein